MQNLCAMFKLFSLAHIVYLLISIAIVVGLYFLMRNMEEKMQKLIGIILVAAAGLLVILEFVGRVMAGLDVGDNLPLAPWNMMAYIAIFVQITKRENWIKFGYLITVPISVLALFITPSVFGTIGSLTLPVLCYFLINSIVILHGLLCIKWADIEFSKKDILIASMNYVIILAAIHIINVILRFTGIGKHANYFGTMGEDYDVMDGLLSKWIPVPFLQIIVMVAVLVGIEFLLILPFAYHSSKEADRAHIEELVALGNLKAQQEYRKSGKGSQVLIRGEQKAKPVVPKNTAGGMSKDGFVSVSKQVNVNNEHRDN